MKVDSVSVAYVFVNDSMGLSCFKFLWQTPNDV